VLRFKHKLSQQITGSSLNGMALKISSYTAATRSFLQNNPFMFEGTDGLCGAMFLEAEVPLDEAMTHQLNKDYGHPGLVRLCTYRLPQAGQLAGQDIYPQIAPGHQMHEIAEKSVET